MERKHPVGLLLLVFLLLVSQVLSAGTAHAALPPREDTSPSGQATQPVGAYLELSSGGVAGAGWAVVQWQDSGGGWQDVEGWQGETAAGCRWWVDAKDFGTGPFRWVVEDGDGGATVAMSQPFNLPATAGATLLVVVEPVE